MSIPTIDLREPAEIVARQLDDACSSFGFMQVVGHGVDPALDRDAWSCASAFFALDEETKLAVAIPDGDAYGYGPFQVERLAASRGESTPPDLKETFSIGPFVDASELQAIVSRDPAAAFAYSPNRWPVEPRGMSDVMQRYYDELAVLCEQLLSLMARGFGMSADTFASSIDRHTSALRLLHYPHVEPSSVASGQLRAGAHSDYGTLTLLRQNDAPGGLEVRGADDEWHQVPAEEGAYVVNIGDALERWTAGRWRSTLHRVQVPSPDSGPHERQSIAFFHNANWDAVIEVLDPCRPSDGEVAPPITAGRHLMERFLSTQRGE
jgi:isopenicillin N synthase-like dioxygenase